jgi:magnesium-transporting ATPase (P-type)
MSTLLLATSFFNEDRAIFAEVLSIYTGVLFSTAVAAGCDLVKEQQKLKIMDEINNQKVIVYRGARGNSTSIAIRDLVVGDIVDLNQGDRIPADCILIEEMNITVDQSLYYETTRDPVKRAQQIKCIKETSMSADDGSDNHRENPDPFLFSNCKVMTGQGKALVCQVGDNTLLAKSRKPSDLVMKEEQTYLEQRLEDVATQVSKYAKLVTFIIVLTQVTFLLVKCLFSEQEIFANKTLLDIGQIAITAVVLLIVAIPEGLPLAVSIAMARSIKNLKEDEIIVKNLESVQACAQLNDLFVGKTGTLTTADLSV